MKERPILFAGPMVRALLDGRKTQTRRIVKPQPALDLDDPADIVRIGSADTLKLGYFSGNTPYRWSKRDGAPEPTLCPYGVVGDRLWVRETWAHYQTVNHVRRMDGRAFDEVSDGFAGYRADGHETIEDFREHVRLMSECDLQAVIINGDRWRPSIHMPRWASRILLEITDVRVQRLQEISEQDAIDEGTPQRHVISDAPVDWIDSFMRLWNSINPVVGSWDSNPWVWAITFKVIT